MNDRGFAIETVAGDGIVIGGSTNSSDGNVQGQRSNYDAYVLCLANDGSIVWQYTLDDGGDEQAFRSLMALMDVLEWVVVAMLINPVNIYFLNLI